MWSGQQMVSCNRCATPLGILSLLCSISALSCLSTLYLDSGDNETMTEDPLKQVQENIPQPLPLQRTDSHLSSSWNDVVSILEPPSIETICKPDGAFGLVCTGMIWKDQLIEARNTFRNVRSLVFANVSHPAESVGVEIEDLKQLFPQLLSLAYENSSAEVKRILSTFPQNDDNISAGSFEWESVHLLNLSGNSIESNWIPKTLIQVFPKLCQLDLSHNSVSSLGGIGGNYLERLGAVDLSDNPLDCTGNFDWIHSVGMTLLNSNYTVCTLPPHQNRAKQILKVYPLVKKVREECRLNCSCYVEYIWEQGREVRSRNAVNCSRRNFLDFPDPEAMPHPTDTLYLGFNQISSLERFTGDVGYRKLKLRNLFLTGNRIASLHSLEGSDWLSEIQTLSLRDNYLTDVPMDMLETLVRQSKRLDFIDISRNKWNCDCHTVYTLRVWLLRHSLHVRNIDDVRCSKTNEQIRHMRVEEWCVPHDDGPDLEVFDVVSIVLAILIVAIICKVYYDYWNYKKYSRLPWLVRKY